MISKKFCVFLEQNIMKDDLRTNQSSLVRAVTQEKSNKVIGKKKGCS